MIPFLYLVLALFTPGAALIFAISLGERLNQESDDAEKAVSASRTTVSDNTDASL